MPASLQALAIVSGVRYMSKIDVMPLVRYSSIASLVREYISSPVI